MKPLPPMKALTYFDSAMRLRSFSLAAEELNVTPGAVSQQIRKLEDWLGVSLFIRQVRQIEPTPEGTSYWGRIQPALAQIINASQALRDSRSAGIWVTMPPSLAAKWFARRMSSFVSSHPTVALHLSTSTVMVDFAGEPVDLAIRYFDGIDPQLDAHLLFTDEARVYCTAAYAQQLDLQQPSDLARATLLHNTLHPHWDLWLARFSGLPAAQIATLPALHFDQSLMTIDAAKRGQGVVLTSSLLTEEEMAEGTLIEPFNQRLPLSKGFYLVHQRQAKLRPAVQAFKDWLIQQAAS
ncbi:LysR family transcriptional regulator [Pseudomonas taeanensis MS-3]|jgi:LysR family glycine cleavage system transcriptional activator|uniref:LysR family transcriptional regulator n=1 Tax=Pseudomonas taeanensis MS-3 TaxID=1395571 RepID=A0A0A1YII7_9PSED|nr:LysR substrate-binding domain-containing protein [Pseudomonas taeanensis]KFX69725.1 LysR family transcriptional regulator [Pseudomonas taeanensis MS-3]